MVLQLSLMTHDDISEFVAVDDAAMAGWGLALAMERTNPTGEPRHKLIERWTRAGFRQDDEISWLKVTDSELNGQMIAAASWQFQLEEKKPTVSGISAAVEVEGEKKPSLPTLMSEMARISTEFNDEFVGTRPHASLALLVTDPKHQGRGAGSMLVKWGCDRADELGLMCRLVASKAGYHLYTQNGFQLVKESGLDLRPFGVDEIEPRKCMIRPPKSKP